MKLKVNIDGKLYEVDVEVAEPEPPHPSYVPPAGPMRPSTKHLPAATPPPAALQIVTDESKACRSPMSGVVVRISAQIGQQIKANDVLMVLEAMKMETVVTSPTDGKIAKVNVKAGDSVRAGQLLIEFE